MRPNLVSTIVSYAVAGALLIGALVAGYLELKQNEAVAVGAAAPHFRLELAAGGEVALDDLRGEVVMLDFWATWCPPCVHEMPSLVKVAQEYEPKGVRFVAANRDEPSEQKVAVSLFVTDRVPGLKPFVAYGDDQMSANYRVEALPTLFILDREGRIFWSTVGEVSEAELKKRLDAALVQPVE